MFDPLFQPPARPPQHPTRVLSPHSVAAIAIALDRRSTRITLSTPIIHVSPRLIRHRNRPSPRWHRRASLAGATPRRIPVADALAHPLGPSYRKANKACIPNQRTVAPAVTSAGITARSRTLTVAARLDGARHLTDTTDNNFPAELQSEGITDHVSSAHAIAAGHFVCVKLDTRVAPADVVNEVFLAATCLPTITAFSSARASTHIAHVTSRTCPGHSRQSRSLRTCTRNEPQRNSLWLTNLRHDPVSGSSNSMCCASSCSGVLKSSSATGITLGYNGSPIIGSPSDDM